MSVGGRWSKGRPINKTPDLLCPVSELYSHVLICQRAWHFARWRVEAGTLAKGQRSRLPQTGKSRRTPEGMSKWMKPWAQTKGWKVERDKRRALSAGTVDLPAVCATAPFQKCTVWKREQYKNHLYVTQWQVAPVWVYHSEGLIFSPVCRRSSKLQIHVLFLFFHLKENPQT